jgi:alkylated DNA nucleotide flippase Atl1
MSPGSQMGPVIPVIPVSPAGPVIPMSPVSLETLMSPASLVTPVSLVRLVSPRSLVSPRDTGPHPAGGTRLMSMTEHDDPAPAEIGDFASDVLDVVDSIPPGHVMSYGDIAEYLGRFGPRRVGRVMSTHGGAVPWWRVIHSDGSMVPGHERAALRQYKKEGTPLRASADGATFRVDMRRARWRGLEAPLEAPGPDGPDIPD